VSLIYDGPHAVKISQLSAQQWHDFAEDIRRVEAAVQHVFTPDHINVECLGNSVPHLHFHFIPRYQSDPRWRHPVWMTERKDMLNVTLNADEYAQLADSLNQTLA
jgi:diadenosine tetraphosphate (Ap4A) HIT family hydrolase